MKKWLTISSINSQAVLTGLWFLLATFGSFICVALLVGLWGVSSAWVARHRPEMTAFVPGPAQVANRGVTLLRDPDLWHALVASNIRVLLGFGAAAAVAIPLGFALGASRRIEQVVGPVLNFARYIPVAALVPLLVLWAGVGDAQKVLTLAIGTLFQILVLTTDAVRRVPTSLVETAQTLGFGRWDRLWRVQIPAALPQIWDGCRLGIGLTWSYLLVAEIVASEQGIGYLILRAQRYLQTDTIFALIFLLGVLGLVYDRLFTLSRTYLFRWSGGYRNQGV